MATNNEAPRHPREDADVNTCPTENHYMENPTREYFNNLRKVELQKLCRQLGLPKVWQTKQQLVEMLLHAYRDQESTQDECSDKDIPTGIINKILNELEDIKGNLAAKDFEINELNLMLKTAHVTINRLNDRISTLEELVQQQPNPDIRPTQIENELTLLIGDNNLNEVRLADLEENCKVKTIKDTTMDLTACWIREKLDLQLSKCIIYCGTNDLIETENFSSVLDDLGSLITELKHKKENVDIYVCELVPHLNIDINSRINMYNEKLLNWCSVNGVNFIKTNLSFRLGTGDIDEICYNSGGNDSEDNLNRYGVLRLLKIINKQCKYLKPRGNMKPNNRERKTNEYNSHHYSKGNFGHYDKRWEPGQFSQVRRSESGTFNQRPTERRQTFRDLPRRVPLTRNTYGTRVNADDDDDRNRRGCFNCGEYNHRRSNCRYDHQIRCNNCYEYGHKSRLCNYVNSF